MATPLVSLMNTITTDFEAATPPDRTTVTYRQVTGKQLRHGKSASRNFAFGYATRAEPLGEAGVALTQVEWLLPIFVRLDSGGRTKEAAVDAAANEVTLLVRTIETQASWPSGVLEVITEDAVPEEDGDDVIYEITVRALCEETD